MFIAAVFIVAKSLLFQGICAKFGELKKYIITGALAFVDIKKANDFFLFSFSSSRSLFFFLRIHKEPQIGSYWRIIIIINVKWFGD